MKPARSLISFAFVLALPMLLPAQAPDAADLTITHAPGVVLFDVTGPEAFLGVVLVAPSPDLVHFLVDLPPLLGEGLVLAWGIGDKGVFHAEAAEALFPPGMFIYAQGVVIGAAVASTAVRSFVLDASGPGR